MLVYVENLTTNITHHTLLGHHIYCTYHCCFYEEAERTVYKSSIIILYTVFVASPPTCAVLTIEIQYNPSFRTIEPIHMPEKMFNDAVIL